MNYEELLDRAFENLPEKEKATERFETPKVKGHIQGNKTVISNFHQIAAYMRRGEEHLLKYLLKELATPGVLTKTALILGTKVPASRINEKLIKYVRDFVICPECGKPDTEITKVDGVTYIRCQACGAKKSVHSKI